MDRARCYGYESARNAGNGAMVEKKTAIGRFVLTKKLMNYKHHLF